jgi:hypothetical protein
VRYLVCKICSKEMLLPIGAQVLAVADGQCRVKVGQVRYKVTVSMKFI